MCGVCVGGGWVGGCVGMWVCVGGVGVHVGGCAFMYVHLCGGECEASCTLELNIWQRQLTLQLRLHQAVMFLQHLTGFQHYLCRFG